jgi:hypothetical protein
MCSRFAAMFARFPAQANREKQGRCWRVAQIGSTSSAFGVWRCAIDFSLFWIHSFIGTYEFTSQRDAREMHTVAMKAVT